MILLDTDHLTVIQRQSEPAYTILRRRLRQTSEPVGTTIVSLEEQMRGWLAVINRAKRIEQQTTAYRQLHRLFTFFGNIPVLEFDDAAAERLTQLHRARIRLGAMDLKIAAIALSLNALLLSRNLTDFLRVPTLSIEDWTHAE